MSIGGNEQIAFFVKECGNSIGGMETHAINFIKFFKEKKLLKYIISKKNIVCVSDTMIHKIPYSSEEELYDFLAKERIGTLFFNDGLWIESYQRIRTIFPKIKMIMRSGGNEFVKAQTINMNDNIKQRQKIWAQNINCLDFILANSSYSVYRMQQIGIKKEKVLLVRGGVNVNACNKLIIENTANKKIFCNNYGIANNQKLIGIVARHEKFKGILETLKVLSKLQKLEWHLIICGEGNETHEIVEFLKSNFSNKKYTLIGSIPSEEALKLISCLDFLINMSILLKRESGVDIYIHTETMGRSMIEAISCNVPIIATNVGGTSELFLENNCVGWLLNSPKCLSLKLKQILNENIKVSLTNREIYDWNYIFYNLYIPMMQTQKYKCLDTNIVMDIDGTISHNFLSEDENKKNFLTILDMCDKSNIIINTANELKDILIRYPYVKKYMDKIIVIANCGKRVFIYGNEFMFWSNYERSLFGPNSQLVERIKKIILERDYKIAKIKKINRLYFNFKVSDVTDDLVSEINTSLEDTAFTVCKNRNNLKLISKEINKENTLRFICNHILSKNYSIGLGNGILDEGFLGLCDEAFLVNNIASTKFKNIQINSYQDMQLFIEMIKNAIKEKENINRIC